MITIRREGTKLNVLRGNMVVRTFELLPDEEVLVEAQEFKLRPVRGSDDSEVRIIL